MSLRRYALGVCPLAFVVGCGGGSTAPTTTETVTLTSFEYVRVIEVVENPHPAVLSSDIKIPGDHLHRSRIATLFPTQTAGNRFSYPHLLMDPIPIGTVVTLRVAERVGPDPHYVDVAHDLYVNGTRLPPCSYGTGEYVSFTMSARGTAVPLKYEGNCAQPLIGAMDFRRLSGPVLAWASPFRD